MAIQLSVTARNDRLDTFESTVGITPKLRILTGTVPADCATVQSGTLLAEMDLPSDWMNGAAAGSKTKLGTWSVTAVAAGVAGYFRILDAAGITCHMQGTVGQGTGDMSLDNTNIANGQVVTVNTFTLNAGNA